MYNPVSMDTVIQLNLIIHDIPLCFYQYMKLFQPQKLHVFRTLAQSQMYEQRGGK